MRRRPDYSKVCIDCVHHKTRAERDGGSKHSAVRHVCEAGRDLVTGQKPSVTPYCFHERGKDGRCGPEGRMFEPKQGKLEAAE